MSVSARIQGQFSPATVNDVHSRFNATQVAGIVRPHSLERVTSAVAEGRAAGLSLAVAGGRHATGGQQFCRGGLRLDTAAPLLRLAELRRFDAFVVRGLARSWAA